jgi:L-rhamnose mutarotase
MEAVDDFQADRDFPKYLERHPRCKEWDQIMCTYQEKVSEAKENEWWAMMEQVYELK